MFLSLRQADLCSRGLISTCSGRRWNCVLYGILYGLSCITKQYPIMNILMIGRFFGGIATSILYSAFESWLVYEHNKVSTRHNKYFPNPLSLSFFFSFLSFFLSLPASFYHSRSLPFLFPLSILIFIFFVIRKDPQKM